MMMKLQLLVLFFVGVWGVTNAQGSAEMKEMKAKPPVCYASGKVEKAFIPPPREFLLKAGEQKCDIIVEYSSNFPSQARTAFDYAVSIWESILESPIPIHVNAKWSSMGDTTLGFCSPETYYSDFKNAPFKNIFYVVAVAEKIAGEELNGSSRSDINAEFNNRSSYWYFGTDGKTPTDKYDFVTVVLHEMAHGLGFNGFFDMNQDIGSYAYNVFGDVAAYDRLIEYYNGNNLVDTSFYQNASVVLGKAMKSNLLYSDSPVAKFSNSGQRPKLFAPSSWNVGSSIYHLNDATYPNGNPNSLMTHAVGMAEAIHDPGPLTMGIMEDLGWTNLFLDFPPAKDREEPGPVEFSATIESYYPIDTASIWVIHSSDNFATKRDSFLLEHAEQAGVFAATLIPESGITDIQYYVRVNDQKGRVRTAPEGAPHELLSVHFGPDHEKPSISHSAISYFLMRGEPLILEAKVNDNLGVDTVMVNYSINGTPQAAFGLNFISGTTYSAAFPFDFNTLKDGDIVTYTITATDASSSKNTSVFPAGEPLSFKVEQIFNPVSYYTNDFNEASPDFLLSDFDIYTAPNFDNGALHSPHPYLSPKVDNKEFNYTTFLKYPIILQEDGDIAYDEVVLVEPGELLANYGDDDFWDYVIVEGSKDFGENWYELADGYDSGSNPIWKENYNANIVSQDSQTQGTSAWFKTRAFSLLRTGNFNAGDTILVRFRLYSDPYASGWGWAIDNLRIQHPMAEHPTTLSPESVNIYPNPFEGSFEVEIETGKELQEIRIDVYDSFGRNIRSVVKTNTGAFRHQIDLGTQSSGLYLVSVSENGKPLLTKKMIKN